jgi:hypothetical protein
MSEAALRHDPVEALWAQARAGNWPLLIDPDLAYERQGIRNFSDLWRSRARNGRIPHRREFTARDLKANLSRLILFEKLDGSRYRVRLMGSALARVWGDLTGQLIDEALPPHLVPRWEALVESVLLIGRPLRVMSRVDYLEQNFLVAEIGAVPLADDAGCVNMVMAVIHASSERPWEEVGRLLKTA